MRITIKENERGFLYKHDLYQRTLGPGRHRLWMSFGETISVARAEGAFESKLNLNVFLQDKDLAAQLATVNVPDGQLALHFVDKRLLEVLTPGQYAFWNVLETNTFLPVDITQPESAATLPALYAHRIPVRYLTRVEVPDGHEGLLFYDGVFQRVLSSGQHLFWNHSIKVSAQLVDTRLQQLDIPGQEILTADKVSLRINFVASYRVTDAVGLVTRLKDCKTQLHTLAQLALRELAGKHRFDELLRQKESLGQQILEALRQRQGEHFVEFLDAGVKDIILPGEIRDIMNTVLVAEKSAQAAVIARREETAATRSLLETARLMDENATLFKLKELEYLERICDKVGSISVDGGGGVLKALKEVVAAK